MDTYLVIYFCLMQFLCLFCILFYICIHIYSYLFLLFILEYRSRSSGCVLYCSCFRGWWFYLLLKYFQPPRRWLECWSLPPSSNVAETSKNRRRWQEWSRRPWEWDTRHKCIHVFLRVKILSVYFLSKPSECVCGGKNSFGMSLPWRTAGAKRARTSWLNWPLPQIRHSLPEKLPERSTSTLLCDQPDTPKHNQPTSFLSK